MTREALLTWINTHDCGVRPCGVMNEDRSITIRVALCQDGEDAGQEETVVQSLKEARDALGY